MPVARTILIVLLLLGLMLAAHDSLSGPVVTAAQAGDAAGASTAPLVSALPGGADSTVHAVHQRETEPSKVSVGLIFGNLLILALYGFPMSIGEGWALADPKEAGKQAETGSPETAGKPDQTMTREAPHTTDDWTAYTERLPDWVRNHRGVPAGLVAGVCLTVAFALLGVAAFALYYHFAGQPEKIGGILARFAYWLPFGLLGLVTDVPFQAFDWEDKRLRVVLRLVLWWLPRVAIIAFAIGLPFLQDLDPLTTALVVLAIDGLLVVLFLWLHRSWERIPTMLR